MKRSAFFLSVSVAIFCCEFLLGANFYVSPDGDDQKDGRTPETAWASISRVNSAAENEIQPGDSVLWQRGGIWRGTLFPAGGEPGKPVTYGAYGDENAAKPTIYGSVSASNEADWEEVTPNVWGTRRPEVKVLGKVDGNFSDSQWRFHHEAGALGSAEFTEEAGCRKVVVDVQKGGTKPNHIQIWGAPADPEKLPSKMLLTLRIRASRPVKVPGPGLKLNRQPWRPKASVGDLEFSTEWQTVKLICLSSDESLPEINSETEAQISKAGKIPQFCWHWNLGGVADGTQLEMVFEDLEEIDFDPSLLLVRDVGNIIFDHGKFEKFHPCGFKRWKLADLKAPGDYFYDSSSSRVFLYWNENPAKTCKSIELAVTQHTLEASGKHDFVCENLAFAYAGAHGFHGTGMARITIRNCDFSFIGGGHQFTYPNGTPVRFGNAIEFWDATEDVLVEKCRIWEIYDAAITNQGRAMTQRRITYRENWIKNAEYSYEYWHGGQTEDVLFEKNTCLDAGCGWAHSQRPNPNGAHLMFYQNSAPTKNFVIRGNRFLNSTEVCLRIQNDWRSGLTLEKNEYQQPIGRPVIRWLGTNYFTARNFSVWQNDLGMDRDSVCHSEGFPERGICAHRGNNAHFPENTVSAFQSAVELGAAQVEMDVYWTKDQKMVVIHDSDVRRTTTGQGNVGELTLAEIQALPVRFQGKVVEGARIPTLEEALAVLPKTIWVNLHVKEKKLGLILEIARLLEREERLAQSFFLCDRSLALEARKTFPMLKICNPPSEATFHDYAESTLKLGFEFVQPNPWKYSEMRPEDVQRLHEAGVKINYFGVRDAAHCAELMKEGVEFPLCDDVTACVNFEKTQAENPAKN